MGADLSPFSTPDVARRAIALARRPLCARCVGRPFAKLGHGLSNAQRGEAVAAAAGLAPVEERDCSWCRGVFLDLPAYVRVATAAVDGIELDTFLVGTRMPRLVEDAGEEVLALCGGETAEPITSELNREIGKRLEPLLGKKVDVLRPHVTILVDTRFHVAYPQIAPLFVYGRYRKLVRDVPQARWPCRRCGGEGCHACGMTGKQYPTSVQEIVQAPAIAMARARDADFHGMGREDIDARMLGRGRPFVLELKEPRVRTLDLASLAGAIHREAGGRVEVESLRLSEREEVVRVKESRSRKVYRALVDFERPPDGEKLKNSIEALPALAVAQRTPTRVEHRRAMLTRERRVLDARLEALSGAQAVVWIRGEAGLYVKELVSGDDGRTSPSLAELVGIPCRVRELDVLDVEAE
ncbi:MAG TPA: tRNA pseudouridine(54/55) synthase Pus10 [Candidatus Thermoplasmatota archaeon]|nr:tRNA pseudouridine(54/55) synthase Pus10 [Candidatus Thermoplasmatota archaeon]